MASDQRDRNFDKAMARHLRSTAPSADAANQSFGAGSQRDSCPDAETLAAYHERSLLPSEMNSWKEHIVGCAHCQELLAHLEATDAIPLHAAVDHHVFAESDAQSAAVSQPPRAAAAKPDTARTPRIVGGARWRFLVPASALAAGLLVWIALHENPRPSLPSTNGTQMAKNQEPPATAPPVLGGTAVASPESRPQLTPPQPPAAADKIASSRHIAAPETLKQSQPYDYSGKATSPKLPAKEENKLQKDKERDSGADQLIGGNRADLDTKSVDDNLRQREALAQAQSDAANAQLQNQANANLSRVAGPAPLGQTGAAGKKMKATAPAPSAPAARAPTPAAASAETATALSVGAVSQMVMVVSDPTRIYAPGANSVWHTGPAGLIEFSPDGGRSWSRQHSGVLVDLLTGSSPSEKVCWIAGRVGAILLTTDGGAHWKLLSSPLKEDLGGIQATDELHALIWNVQNKKRFSTSDGGLTWERVGP